MRSNASRDQTNCAVAVATPGHLSCEAHAVSVFHRNRPKDGRRYDRTGVHQHKWRLHSVRTTAKYVHRHVTAGGNMQQLRQREGNVTQMYLGRRIAYLWGADLSRWVISPTDCSSRREDVLWKCEYEEICYTEQLSTTQRTKWATCLMSSCRLNREWTSWRDNIVGYPTHCHLKTITPPNHYISPTSNSISNIHFNIILQPNVQTDSRFVSVGKVTRPRFGCRQEEAIELLSLLQQVLSTRITTWWVRGFLPGGKMTGACT